MGARPPVAPSRTFRWISPSSQLRVWAHPSHRFNRPPLPACPLPALAPAFGAAKGARACPEPVEGSKGLPGRGSIGSSSAPFFKDPLAFAPANSIHPVGTAKLIDFLKEAFGAEDVARHQLPEGTVVHAKVRIGDSIVEMGEAHAEYQPMPTMFYMYVNNVDAAYERALKAAGAKSISAPADQPYGDRRAAVEDPSGNQWYLATHIKDVAP